MSSSSSCSHSCPCSWCSSAAVAAVAVAVVVAVAGTDNLPPIGAAKTPIKVDSGVPEEFFGVESPEEKGEKEDLVGVSSYTVHRHQQGSRLCQIRNYGDWDRQKFCCCWGKVLPCWLDSETNDRSTNLWRCLGRKRWWFGKLLWLLSYSFSSSSSSSGRRVCHRQWCGVEGVALQLFREMGLGFWRRRV